MISIHKAFSDSFSSYWNEISKIFFNFFSCQNNETSIHILCPQSGLKHSVVHSQVIGVKFQLFFFEIFLCQNNEISIHILCPQSGLKHSVVHSQVIGMKFQRFFFKIFLCQNNEISIHILCPQSGLKWPVQHRIRFPLKGVLGGEWSPGRAARARAKRAFIWRHFWRARGEPQDIFHPEDAFQRKLTQGIGMNIIFFSQNMLTDFMSRNVSTSLEKCLLVLAVC